MDSLRRNGDCIARADRAHLVADGHLPPASEDVINFLGFPVKVRRGGRSGGQSGFGQSSACEYMSSDVPRAREFPNRLS